MTSTGIYIYKGEVSVCLSVCLSVCPYVRASLEDGESDLGRISPKRQQRLRTDDVQRDCRNDESRHSLYTGNGLSG